MLFLGIITIQILQVMVISGDRPLLESVYIIKLSTPTKPGSGSSPLDLSALAEIFIMENSIATYTLRSLGTLTFLNLHLFEWI